jgi:hypothetical protein
MGRGVTGVEHWKQVPDEHDYPAAEDYLSLVVTPTAAKKLTQRFRVAPIVHRKAKDLLRASGLSLLAPENVHVAKDLKKVTEGTLLSPVLLVRGILRAQIPLVVADGYHRICASYHLDENADIPCRIVDLAGAD